MSSEDIDAARLRTVAALDRHVPDWMWALLADELERLEARGQSEVVLCMNNAGKFYLAAPARIPVTSTTSRVRHVVSLDE